MTEFDITIDGNEYNGQLITSGHGFKIVLFIDDIAVVFEPDEERNFRAVVPPEDMNRIDAELLKRIAAELEINLKS